ncbi:hypothetical protein HMPREF1093_01996 [Hungatella hathewayi 12489931]|uniref:uroporphyrinogen decarboxylase family protein n=1 Tax=Hungatella hathewayi TaxID=154046 RepID=UPI0002D1530C|nr:uroporphyrinogen decarboxylase family protein [Hungatella hathewayi]ENY96985.1 hypothetical protein HMPREF1093_01996 [Hungatella hathewayi 12489931]
MTKRERVIRAVRGEETDGIPSCFSMHFSPEYANGESAVDAHIQFLKQTDTDILKIMNENLVTCDHELITRQDYESFQKISAEQPFMKRQLDLVKRILEEADGQCFTIGTLHSVGTSAMYHPFKSLGYGYDQSRKIFDAWLNEAPEKVLESMKRITDGLCELAVKYIEAGLDGVFVASLGAERRFGLTREQFIEWVAPFDQMIMKTVKDAGGYCFLHVCNRDVNLDYYRDYDENLYDVVNWGTFEVPCSIREGREIFHQKTVMGGLANRQGVLAAGSEEALINTVHSIVESYGRKGLILGADCTVATEQDLSRIKLAVETARKL